ncbi:hypothetical protein RND71_040678 [Anisodus tanguticus]|uniref:Uncharacterized protein n=1 Tax=Anisodus tanguticus TaxID=243964 RepID=A0AAE1QTG2_9SOLA|nr:hypothetical protein RND71_040678 [Anisodus tanguticus]
MATSMRGKSIRPLFSIDSGDVNLAELHEADLEAGEDVESHALDDEDDNEVLTDASYNMLSGKLPNVIGKLGNLEYLDLSGNLFEGEVSEIFNAEHIKIRGWNIGPLFPVWFRTQKLIWDVDISDGGILGEVPTWFWNLTSQIRILNLSHNQFVGEVPNISPPSIEYGDPWLMYLGSNNFSGPLPQISTNVSLLDLSKNSFSKGLSNLLCEAKNKSYKLEILNLEGNDLSEEIPDCWMNWPELRFLILRDNNLIGGIPKSMEVLSNLQSLDLGRNRLNGPFPSSLGNCIK